MGFNNVTFISGGIFGEDRVIFDGFDKDDFATDDKKVGVRCHNWFTAFFLRIFGKIEDKEINGVVYHLNKGSLDKWKERHAADLKISKPTGELPSIDEIVAAQKTMLEQTAKAKEEKKAAAAKAKQDKEAAAAKAKEEKEAAAAKAKQENEAALTFQKAFRGQRVRKLLPELKTAKGELDQAKKALADREKEQEAAKAQFTASSNAVETTKKDFEGKIAALEAEIGKLNQSLTEKTPALGELKSSLDSKKAERANAKKEKSKVEDNKVEGFFKDLLKIKADPEQQAKLQAIKSKMEGLDKEIEDLETSYKALKTEIEDLLGKLAEKEPNLGHYQEQLKGLPAISAKMQKEHTELLAKLEKRHAEAKATLEKKNAAYDAVILKMNGHTPAEKSANLEAPAIISDEQGPADHTITGTAPLAQPEEEAAPEITEVKKMYTDIKANTHPELVKILEAIVKKFGPEAISTWEFDAHSGKFKIELDKTCKLWVRPTTDEGKPDTKTPKGIVLLFGNNNLTAIEGRLDKKNNAIEFTKGLTTYCAYKKKIGPFNKEGIADGMIQRITYSPKDQKVSIAAKGTDRDLGMGGDETDVKKLDTMLKDWEAGLVPSDEENHEQFLGKQQVK